MPEDFLSWERISRSERRAGDELFREETFRYPWSCPWSCTSDASIYIKTLVALKLPSREGADSAKPVLKISIDA